MLLKLNRLQEEVELSKWEHRLEEERDELRHYVNATRSRNPKTYWTCLCCGCEFSGLRAGSNRSELLLNAPAAESTPTPAFWGTHPDSRVRNADATTPYDIFCEVVLANNLVRTEQ